MPSVTEPLPVVGASVQGRLPLVPILCGIVISTSWAAGCLAIVLPH